MGDMDLEGLKKLLAEATLPWFVADGGVCSRECPDDGSNVVCLEPEQVMAASLARWPEHAKLIVAAVNSLPGIIEHVERLEQALRPFADEATNWSDDVPDNYRSLCFEPGARHAHPGSETAFTVGDLRKARQVTAEGRDG